MLERNSIKAVQNGSEAKNFKNLREPLNTKVTIFRHSFPYAVRRSKNVGSDGIFVSTAPLNFTKNTYLEVEFELVNNLGSRIFRLPVYVDHITDKGMNLLFVEPFDDNVFTVFNQKFA